MTWYGWFIVGMLVGQIGLLGMIALFRASKDD